LALGFRSPLAFYQKKRASIVSAAKNKRGLHFSNHGNALVSPCFLFSISRIWGTDCFDAVFHSFQIIPEKNRREISKYLFQGNFVFITFSVCFLWFRSNFSHQERNPWKIFCYFSGFWMSSSSCGFRQLGLQIVSVSFLQFVWITKMICGCILCACACVLGFLVKLEVKTLSSAMVLKWMTTWLKNIRWTLFLGVLVVGYILFSLLFSLVL